MDKNHEKSAKKKLLIIIGIIIGVLCLLICALFVMEYIEKNNAPSYEEQTIDYDFYPADFNENIYDDSEYLEILNNGLIAFTNEQSGVTVSIDKDTADDYGDATAFMVDMIYDIVEGNSRSYNARFSEEYYKNHSQKDDFTMQKLADVNLTYVRQEKDSETNSIRYLYTLEYRIDKNNGTFRKDIGDGSKKQYIVLSEAQGKIEILSISTVKLAK